MRTVRATDSLKMHGVQLKRTYRDAKGRVILDEKG